MQKQFINSSLDPTIRHESAAIQTLENTLSTMFAEKTFARYQQLSSWLHYCRDCWKEIKYFRDVFKTLSTMYDGAYLWFDCNFRKNDWWIISLTNIYFKTHTYICCCFLVALTTVSPFSMAKPKKQKIQTITLVKIIFEFERLIHTPV